MANTNATKEDINKLAKAINKRFDDVDKKLVELREFVEKENADLAAMTAREFEKTRREFNVRERVEKLERFAERVGIALSITV